MKADLPHVGEMSGRTEGGATERDADPVMPGIRMTAMANLQDSRRRSTLPPSVLPDISPTWGEIGRFALIGLT